MFQTKKILKYLAILFVTSFITIVLFEPILLPMRDSLFVLLDDKWEWLQVYWRVMLDGYNSGYVRGTPFKTAQGHWAVSWRLGGQQFIHVILPWTFTCISLLGLTSLFIYLVPKYWSFRRLKNICTHLRHPKNFRNCISVGIIAALLIISFVGIMGIKINPNVIVPAEPSKDYLECSMHITATLSITITRFVIVEATPSILYENNMSGWFYCIIKTPENSCWSISEIDTFKILLNDKIIPYIKSIHYDNNSTEFILAKSDKSFFAFLFENESSIKLETVTLKVDGKLKNGDFFAGDTQIRIIFT